MRLRTYLVALCCTLLVSLSGKPAFAADGSVPVYTPFELSLTATGTYESPYLQMPGDSNSPGFVTGTFTGPGGKTITLDGFWDGGNSWKIRMAPTVEGEWTYVTNSADGGLDNVQGSFTATTAAGKGFIGIDPANRDRFVWSDGTPYLPKQVSMTVHAGKQGGGLFNYGGWMSDGSYQQFIDARAAQGFNAMNWGMVISKWGLNSGSGTQQNEGGQPFANMDMNNPLNPAYFQATDDRVEYALSRGIIPQFGIMWPDSRPSGWTSERGKRLWRYIIARYAAYNVTWNLFGEGHEFGSDSELNDWGLLTKARDPYDHVTSFHTSNESGVQGQQWMDYLTLQMFSGEETSHVESNLAFGKPVIFAEYYGYDDALDSGFGATPEAIRKKVWKIWTSGAYPVYETWGSRLDTEAVGYVSTLWEFVESTGWNQLRPAQGLVSNGRCLAAPGSEYVVYLESGGSLQLDLSSTASDIEARWYNPSTGTYTATEARNAPHGNESFSSPTSGLSNSDWVLHVTTAGSTNPDDLPPSPPVDLIAE